MTFTPFPNAHPPFKRSAPITWSPGDNPCSTIPFTWTEPTNPYWRPGTAPNVNPDPYQWGRTWTTTDYTLPPADTDDGEDFLPEYDVTRQVTGAWGVALLALALAAYAVSRLRHGNG